MSDDLQAGAPAPRVPLGGDYWQVDPGPSCGASPICTLT